MASRVAYLPTAITPNHGFWRDEKLFGGAIPLLATDINVVGNSVSLFKVPLGFVFVSAIVDCPALDSGGSKALTLSLGDAANPGRFILASNIGQAGGTSAPIVTGSRGYRFAVATDILLTTVAAAASAVPGTPVIYLTGYIDD